MRSLSNQELRQLKVDVVDQLRAKRIDYRRISRLDKRLTEYLKGCIGHPDEHNLYELLAVRHFLGMMDRYELHDARVRHFITFYESIRFPSDRGMQRFDLTPVQVFQFASILWFWHKGGEKRVVREALLFVPRKFSKTTSVASLAVYDLLYGDANAQSYVGSNSYDQSQVCFSVIKQVLKALDPKLRRFKINREQVYNLCAGKTSFARCLASEADKLDGLNASLVIIDEYAQAESDALKNVLTSSMGARKNPLTVVITTASDKNDTPFTEMLEGYKAVLRGELDNDSIFAHLFEPDVDDEEDDPKTWRKVQPHLGVTVQEDFYPEEWKKAQLTSGARKEFRNKLLNLFARDERHIWIERETIERQFRKLPMELLRGSRAMCAVDLSVKDDFSAVTFVLFTPGRVDEGTVGECPFHSITYYYFPEGALEGHPNKELYKRWASEGYLILCCGRTIDYQQIVDDILSQPLYTLMVGYDAYKALEFVNLLSSAPGVGKEHLQAVPQTNGSFNASVDSFELTIDQGKITFDPNPITAYCFANAVIDEDRMENRKPIKEQQTKKIDGAITNLMCFWLFHHFQSVV